MRKIMIYTILGILVIAVGVIIISYLSNPLRKSEGEIREDMLKLTPVGTSMEDVIKVIEDNEQWYKNYRYYEESSKYRRYDYGFFIKNGRAVMRHQGYQYDDTEMIGKETIVATIGQYIKFFEVTVFAYWAFNEDGKLVDIAVTKSSNSF